MKKIIGCVLICLFTLLTACGSREKNAEVKAADIAGKKYAYVGPNGAANSFFSLSLYEDGTCIYSQPLYSSVLPVTTWKVEDNKVVVGDPESSKANYFEIKDGALIYIAEDSAGFPFYDLKGGDVLKPSVTLDKKPFSYDRQPEETTPISDPKIPYDTDKTGALGSYFFIPIENRIYRYGIFSRWDDHLTKTELIYEFIEQGIGENYEHKIYRIAEYPDDTRLYCISTTKDGSFREESLIYYVPTTRSDKNELEKAIENGFVVMKNGSVTQGKDRWQEFYKKVSAGEQASVRIAHYYTLDKERASEEYYESVKEDYPMLFLKELNYDGEQYLLYPMHSTELGYTPEEQPGYDTPASSWKYLMHFTGKPSSPTALFTDYDKYVLVNDDTVTWKKLEWGIVSSQLGDYIPFEEVYCEYTYK
ncbi:MAG: hypothetical protein IJS80_02670 [Lachnospiraceae bacterium]|nr:hypothetical protein [Lachnospiraceae bacterium]